MKKLFNMLGYVPKKAFPERVNKMHCSIDRGSKITIRFAVMTPAGRRVIDGIVTISYPLRTESDIHKIIDDLAFLYNATGIIERNVEVTNTDKFDRIILRHTYIVNETELKFHHSHEAAIEMINDRANTALLEQAIPFIEDFEIKSGDTVKYEKVLYVSQKKPQKQ